MAAAASTTSIRAIHRGRRAIATMQTASTIAIAGVVKNRYRG